MSRETFDEGTNRSRNLREAETVPAPPSEDDKPTVRATPVPVAELPIASSSYTALPLDLAVPVRIRGAVTASSDDRAALVLQHVDGRTPLPAIAEATHLAMPEVLGIVLTLLSEGVVDLSGEPAGLG